MDSEARSEPGECLLPSHKCILDTMSAVVRAINLPLKEFDFSASYCSIVRDQLDTEPTVHGEPTSSRWDDLIVLCLLGTNFSHPSLVLKTSELKGASLSIRVPST